MARLLKDNATVTSTAESGIFFNIQSFTTGTGATYTKTTGTTKILVHCGGGGGGGGGYSSGDDGGGGADREQQQLNCMIIHL